MLFIVGGMAIHLYVFHRDHMSPRDHHRLIWIVALCSVGTLLIINAILSFMLTPGTWKPMDVGVLAYKGLMNPGYLPTSLGRILISLAVGRAGGVLLASRTESIGEKARRKLVRISCAMISPIILRLRCR